ncbi:MAG: phosphoglucosamine mutase [Coriobacteriaceae bacterium]|nr:phosphoglucosamine mutase [Coriobacteriaceae bacterium]
MAKLFGTDGARGVANKELTCDIAFKLGQAAVRFLGKTIVVGKDTRLSGDMLESALNAGIMSAGGNVLQLGVIPTPAVALLTRQLVADGGVVISASHNPPEYNGIKFFDREGYKLPVDLERRIEAFVGDGGIPADELPGGDAVGTVMPVDDAVEIYIEHAVDSVRSQGIDFSSWRIALDVAHGAAAVASAEALRRLGAEVVVINEDYCGTDINVKCGSTYLEPLRQLVCKTRAHVGIAHDGDADRVLFVDAHGNDIDGDMVEAACAIDLKKRGLLRGDTVVSTVMCNLGFVHAMREAGIEVEQTAVGDRHVLERMREGGYVLGGEQSGHTIFLDYNTTGDGLVTACQFLAAITRGDSTAQTAAAAMMRFPQELINVRVTDKDAVAGNVAIHKAIVAAEEEMGESGRVLVRASGTEPLIRVMVEAASAEEAKRHATAIADVVTEELGA